MGNLLIGKLGDFPIKELKEVTSEGKSFLIANVEGKLYALDGKCSHNGGTLAEGYLEGSKVTCPIHYSEFDVTTGKLLKGPWVPFGKAKDLRSYKLIIEGEKVFLVL